MPWVLLKNVSYVPIERLLTLYSFICSLGINRKPLVVAFEEEDYDFKVGTCIPQKRLCLVVDIITFLKNDQVFMKNSCRNLKNVHVFSRYACVVEENLCALERQVHVPKEHLFVITEWFFDR